MVIDVNLIKRFLLYFLGLAVMTAGVALSTRANIGVAPVASMYLSLSLLTPLTMGACSTIFQLLCVLMQVILTKRVGRQHLLQIPVAWLFGVLVDFFLNLLRFRNANFFVGLVLLVPGALCVSLGIWCIMCADMIMSPPDMLTLTIGNKLGWPMAKAKLAFDIGLVVASAALTTVLFGSPFVAVGVGTLVFAVVTGPGIRLFQKLLPFLDLRKKAASG